MLSAKHAVNDSQNAEEMMRDYDQYFTANSNAVVGQQGASSFAIYTAYDYSIPVTYSDSSIPKATLKHS